MAENIEKIVEIEEDTLKERYLTFSIGKESYGIEVKYVTEIIGIQTTIMHMPELPDYVKGIINLRGNIIPVIDIRLRFKKESKEYTDRTCTIVINELDTSIGLIVDSVSEVITIPEGDTVDPPQLNRDYNCRYVKNIGKIGENVILILDCEKLLTADEMENINEVLK